MKLILLLVFTSMLTHFSHGQGIEPVAPADQAPGTIKALCEMVRLNKTECSIKVLKILATGQGVTNPLAEGDILPVRTALKRLGKPSDRLVVDLKEKIGVDASKSEFVVVSAKKEE